MFAFYQENITAVISHYDRYGNCKKELDNLADIASQITLQAHVTYMIVGMEINYLIADYKNQQCALYISNFEGGLFERIVALSNGIFQ
jgi:hypothetical protein